MIISKINKISYKMKNIISHVKKSGRSWNGFHKDAGIVVHAINGIEPNGYWGGKALCGSEPGLRSSGWSLAQDFHSRTDIKVSKITCLKCINRLKPLDV